LFNKEFVRRLQDGVLKAFHRRVKPCGFVVKNVRNLVMALGLTSYPTKSM